VPPPPGAAEHTQGTLSAAAQSQAMPPQTEMSDIFAYPKNGQTSEQQAKDTYECHRWAVRQSGFDPTANSTPSTAASSSMKKGDNRRAEIACLQGRDYSVK
jgi:hypothetical protein